MPIQGRSVAAEELRAFLKSRIAHYKVPKEVIEPALPLLPNGKIDKRALAARFTAANG